MLALCEIEQQQREAYRVERYLRDSQLPGTKSLTNFEFSCCPTVDRDQVLQLATDPSWLERGENLLILGPSGVGKTHLGVGVSRSLIELGHRVKFASATCLVQQLQQAKAERVRSKPVGELIGARHLRNGELCASSLSFFP